MKKITVSVMSKVNPIEKGKIIHESISIDFDDNEPHSPKFMEKYNIHQIGSDEFILIKLIALTAEMRDFLAATLDEYHAAGETFQAAQKLDEKIRRNVIRSLPTRS